LFWAILQAAAGQPATGASVDLGYLIYIQDAAGDALDCPLAARGTALAWALNRLRFPAPAPSLSGSSPRRSLQPGLVVAFGLLSVWGRSGWFGFAGLPVFGLGGVVAAHLILDGAFAARILLARLDVIPRRELKTGQSLALTSWTRFAVIDWPALRGTLPALRDHSSFWPSPAFPSYCCSAAAPSVQTIESPSTLLFGFDFDLALAVKLALVCRSASAP